MNYPAVLAWLEGRGQFRVTPSLEGITRVLKELGRPQDRYKVILVGGTNGKGVTAFHLSRMLQAHGLRVGRYISPHLNGVRERIAMDDVPLSPEALARVFTQTLEAATRVGVELTYFESLTASAYLHFARQDADWAVMEVGLGGTWDATNVVRPEATVITTVAHDHTRILGRDLTEIAGAKADLIHPGCLVVTGATGEALEVIRGKAVKERARLLVLGRDLVVQKARPSFSHDLPVGMDFGLDFEGQVEKELWVNLPGVHQAHLAALAWGTVRILLANDFRPVWARAALSMPPPPGRWELVPGEPPVLLDGAHNPQALAALGQLIRLVPGPVVAVVTQMRDKDENALLPLADRVGHFIATSTSGNDRSLTTAEQGERLRTMGVSFTIEADLRKALGKARALAGKSNGLVLVTGSFYLVAEARQLMGLAGAEAV